MRKVLLVLLLVVAGMQVFAQKIETDVFDNLVYQSQDERYKAYLKQNIFDDLIFSDSNGNEVIFKKKYLDLEYGDLLNKPEEKLDLFTSLIHEHEFDRGYKAKYAVDIFDKLVIEDNRNGKVEIGEDIFGNETYEEEFNGEKRSVKRGLNGELKYDASNEDATLQKDIFDRWTYSDSLGNEFKFSRETWRGLKKRFGSEENIFHYLINEFLYLSH